MIKGFKVKLKVNNKENKKLFESAGVSRWAYNYTLSRTEEHYKETGKFIGDREIRKEITVLKQTEKYLWLYDYSNNITKQAVKDIAITSDGKKYKNINKDKKIRGYKKLMKRLQRKVSKQYEKNKIKTKGGEDRYQKTNNIIKTENKIRKLHIRLTNIRTDYIHKITTNIVKTKPEFVAMEDLNIKGLMKNKYLSKSIQEQKLYEFKRQLGYKCDCKAIKLIEVDRWFPSSKTCNACGKIKKDLKLSDRTYICECGYNEDRDFNAALNLRDYGLKLMAN